MGDVDLVVDGGPAGQDGGGAEGHVGGHGGGSGDVGGGGGEYSAVGGRGGPKVEPKMIFSIQKSRI